MKDLDDKVEVAMVFLCGYNRVQGCILVIVVCFPLGSFNVNLWDSCPFECPSECPQSKTLVKNSILFHFFIWRVSQYTLFQSIAVKNVLLQSKPTSHMIWASFMSVAETGSGIKSVNMKTVIDANTTNNEYL